MDTAKGLQQLETALRGVPPHTFAARLPGLLDEFAGLRGACVRLVDYPAAGLVPLDRDDDPLRVTGSMAGAAYREQQPVLTDDGQVHLPLTSRGDCVGVLTARVDAEPDAARMAELGDVAAAVADALRLVDLVTDQLAVVRRNRRMTVAAEMQWELLPGRGLSCPELTLAGQLEPAYAVRGDNFDWSLDPGKLTLTMTNGMEEGLDAATLTAIAITALRNARRSGHGLVEAAALADQTVWGQYGGERYVAALLMSIDLATGALQLVDAGSPHLWVIRGDEPRRILLDQQVPLGSLEETQYRVQHESLRPGDRLLAVSDGVYASSSGGRRYDDVALPRLMRTTRALPPSQVVRAVLSELGVFRHHTDLDDDAVVVCLDWRGPAA